jgi:hypothetical protein
VSGGGWVEARAWLYGLLCIGDARAWILVNLIAARAEVVLVIGFSVCFAGFELRIEIW